MQNHINMQNDRILPWIQITYLSVLWMARIIPWSLIIGLMCREIMNTFVINKEKNEWDWISNMIISNSLRYILFSEVLPLCIFYKNIKYCVFSTTVNKKINSFISRKFGANYNRMIFVFWSNFCKYLLRILNIVLVLLEQ